MRLLRGYIRGAVIGPFLFSLGACTGLLLINQLAKRFADLVGKDLPWQVIVEVLLLSIPFIIALTLPMAVLVAVLYGYSQLGQDNEITAMRASGVSVLGMLRPALTGGILLTLVNFLFVDQILPRTNARLGNLQTDISQKKPAFAMREQVINALPPYSIRASRVFPGSGLMRDVEIFDQSLIDGRRVVYADSGVMVFDEKGVDLILELFNGKVHEYKTAEAAKIQITRFAQNTVRVKNVQNMFERDTTNFHRGDREMTTCEMMDQVTIARRQAVRSEKIRRRYLVSDLRGLMRMTQDVPSGPVDTTKIRHCGNWRRWETAIGRFLLPQAVQAQTSMPARPAPSSGRLGADSGFIADTTNGAPAVAQSAPPLLTNLTEVASSRQDRRAALISADKYRVEIHKKYTISVACLSFVLIGVALALRFPRGGMGLVIGGGLTIFAVFYVGLVGGEALADRGFISPPTAMWAPNIIVAAIGIYGLFRVNKEFGSTRGGDLSELFESLRRPFRFRRRKAA